MAGLSGGDWERRWIPRLTSCPFSRPHCLRHRPAPPAGAGACISLHRHPHCPATPIHPHHFIPPTPLSPLCSPLSGTLPSRTCLLLPASRRPSHALSAFTFILFLSPRLFGATPSSLLYAGGNLASAPLSLPVYHGPAMFRSTLPVHCPPSVLSAHRLIFRVTVSLPFSPSRPHPIHPVHLPSVRLRHCLPTPGAVASSSRSLPATALSSLPSPSHLSLLPTSVACKGQRTQPVSYRSLFISVVICAVLSPPSSPSLSLLQSFGAPPVSSPPPGNSESSFLAPVTPYLPPFLSLLRGTTLSTISLSFQPSLSL